jgi:RNA polymerase sigma-70 factor (ECF subfamily)
MPAQEEKVTTLHNLSGHGRGSVVGTGSRSDSAALVVDLFENYHTAVFAYLYRMVNDRDLAHDLSQETFLRLFRARHRLPQVENPRAYVYRIATNVALNALKRRRRFAWLPWRNTDAVYLTAPDPTEQADQRFDVEQALARLPLHYRAPLLLYCHYGFNVREVAEALGISEGAVKTRLHRAREMFRQEYQGGRVA